MTALHLACYEGKVEAARVLIEKGQVSSGGGDSGWGVVQGTERPLPYASTFITGGHASPR